MEWSELDGEEAYRRGDKKFKHINSSFVIHSVGKLHVQGETEAGGGGAVGRGGQLGGRQGEGVQEEVRAAQVKGERGKEDLQIALPLYYHGALGVVLIPSTGRRAAQNFRRCCCCSSSVIRVLRGCNQRRREGGGEGRRRKTFYPSGSIL